MNRLLTGVLIMMMALSNIAAADSDTQDQAAIMTIVESVGVLADQGNFEALERLYADEITVDYTSLSGGDVEIKSPQALMLEWAQVLPGFDRTRHNLSDIRVTVNGSAAEASANVIADHYVDDLFWQVQGSYRYVLERSEDRWQIVSHTFTLRGEEGTRDVFAAAIDNAEQRPASYVLRRQTEQTVRDFLSSLEDKDMEAFASLWAEDAVQDMPYSPDGHPKRVVGKTNLIELYAAWPSVSGNADFTSQLVFYPMLDPQTVFVAYKGSVDIIPTGREYRQTYGGLFHVEGGKITLFREYFDPEPFRWAFDLGDGA